MTESFTPWMIDVLDLIGAPVDRRIVTAGSGALAVDELIMADAGFEFGQFMHPWFARRLARHRPGDDEPGRHVWLSRVNRIPDSGLDEELELESTLGAAGWSSSVPRTTRFENRSSCSPARPMSPGSRVPRFTPWPSFANSRVWSISSPVRSIRTSNSSPWHQDSSRFGTDCPAPLHENAPRFVAPMSSGPASTSTLRRQYSTRRASGTVTPLLCTDEATTTRTAGTPDAVWSTTPYSFHVRP